MTTEVTVPVAFNPDAAAYIHTRGNGRVDGQAFMRQAGGDVVTAAGEEVVLRPWTPYHAARIAALFPSGKTNNILALRQVANDDPRVTEFQRRTIADAEGRFSFDGVAPGEYYVSTVVRWIAPGPYGGTPQGGAIYERVTISGGSTVSLIMTGR